MECNRSIMLKVSMLIMLTLLLIGDLTSQTQQLSLTNGDGWYRIISSTSVRAGGMVRIWGTSGNNKNTLITMNVSLMRFGQGGSINISDNVYYNNNHVKEIRGGSVSNSELVLDVYFENISNPSNLWVEIDGENLSFSNALYNPNVPNGNVVSISGKVIGTKSTKWPIFLDGKIGIGTPTPTAKLHLSSNVSGDAVLKIESDIDNNYEGDNSRIELLQDGGSLGAYIGFNLDWGGTNGVQGVEPGNLFSIGTRYSNTNDFNRLVINTMNGNVGIGTINPDEKLTVNGTIHSTEVKVDLTVPGPDYVFESDYDLRTLAETEEYIKANKHLPEIPSAKEMEANGVELGEMNMLLLKKIEELTLYVLDLKKENDAQQLEIEKLKQRD